MNPSVTWSPLDRTCHTSWRIYSSIWTAARSRIAGKFARGGRRYWVRTTSRQLGIDYIGPSCRGILYPFWGQDATEITISWTCSCEWKILKRSYQIKQKDMNLFCHDMNPNFCESHLILHSRVVLYRREPVVLSPVQGHGHVHLLQQPRQRLRLAVDLRMVECWITPNKKKG